MIALILLIAAVVVIGGGIEASRRMRFGRGSAAKHHRALDTLGHIATQSPSQAEHPETVGAGVGSSLHNIRLVVEADPTHPRIVPAPIGQRLGPARGENASADEGVRLLRPDESEGDDTGADAGPDEDHTGQNGNGVAAVDIDGEPVADVDGESVSDVDGESVSDGDGESVAASQEDIGPVAGADADATDDATSISAVDAESASAGGDGAAAGDGDPSGPGTDGALPPLYGDDGAPGHADAAPDADETTLDAGVPTGPVRVISTISADPTVGGGSGAGSSTAAGRPRIDDDATAEAADAAWPDPDDWPHPAAAAGDRPDDLGADDTEAPTRPQPVANAAGDFGPADPDRHVDAASVPRSAPRRLEVDEGVRIFSPEDDAVASAWPEDPDGGLVALHRPSADPAGGRGNQPTTPSAPLPAGEEDGQDGQDDEETAPLPPAAHHDSAAHSGPAPAVTAAAVDPSVAGASSRVDAEPEPVTDAEPGRGWSAPQGHSAGIVGEEGFRILIDDSHPGAGPRPTPAPGTGAVGADGSEVHPASFHGARPEETRAQLAALALSGGVEGVGGATGRSNRNRRASRGSGRHRSARRRSPVRLLSVAVIALALASAAVLGLGRHPTKTPTHRIASPPTRVVPPATTAPPQPVSLVGQTSSTATYRVTGSPSISLEGKAKCWMEVRQNNGSGPLLYEGILEPGQHHDLTGPVWVRLGNPPAVSVLINGTPINSPSQASGDPFDLQFQ